ncbi:hypothetical protein [Labrenzia sp. PHM005]|uniref:hypothetical protein n=1 Tax=Labrenzia sp. PHM005 TaxID=2590016 RepID=UPI00114070B8|nr:hypothetical protein [Labrenzia sp. PHM005]QDG74421.1 hypothetical protein FJ695_00215 [Labrenzia sp. PHM005]
MRFLVFLAVFIAHATTVYAAEHKCDFKHFKDNVRFGQSIEMDMAILSIIDQSNWERGGKQIAAGGGYGGISGNASYEEFHETRKELYKKFKYEDKSRYTTSYLADSLSDNGLEAYLACLEGTRHGLSVEVVKVTDTRVRISVAWNPSPSQPEAIDITIGKLIGAEKPDDPVTTLKRGIRKFLDFDRKPNSEFSVTIDSPIVSSEARDIPKPLKLPEGTILLNSKFWLAAPEYESSNDQRVNRTWLAEIPKNKETKEQIATFTFGGPQSVMTDVFPDGSYEAYIVFHGKREGGGRRKIGVSRFQLGGCKGEIPCTHAVSTKRVF